MTASGQVELVTVDNTPTHKVSEEMQTGQDEYPTEPISDTKVSAYGQGDFAKFVESIIEGYEIIEELPRGGQGIVFKAVHTATKTSVAIKVLLPTLLASARARYYCEREAELIASLDHPNIVKIRDSGIIHGQYYFVMEYIEGQTLNRYVHLEKLSFRERMLLFGKICGAVTYAHQQGIIHRDLKFANILIDKRGEPHILDFGVAKAVGLSEGAGKSTMATTTGQLAGSLSIMSPEQAAGQPHLIDVRTDVYSLGVVLYYILTGQYPYDVSGSTLEVLQNIQKAEPVRPRQIIRKFDSDVEAILLTALAKERAERYQSAADLQSDIENWLERRPIHVRSVSTIYLLRKIIARHRYTSTVAALLLLIVLGFSYVSFDFYITARKAKKESDAIEKQWATETAKRLLTVRQLAFTRFLKVWHDGLSTETQWMANYPTYVASLSEDSREKIATSFLLNPKSLAEKEAEFREELSDEYTWFADFIIGEHHLKNGKRQEAIAAYQRSYAAIYKMSPSEQLRVDRWVAVSLVSRLDELKAAYIPAEESEKQKSEN
jgi:serine/threonine protein kinase